MDLHFQALETTEFGMTAHLQQYIPCLSPQISCIGLMKRRCTRNLEKTPIFAWSNKHVLGSLKGLNDLTNAKW